MLPRHKQGLAHLYLLPNYLSSYCENFGTIIMSRHGSSVVDSSSELFDYYPKFKKHLKSLAMGAECLTLVGDNNGGLIAFAESEEEVVSCL